MRLRSLKKLDRTRQLLKYSLEQIKVGGKFPYLCYRVYFKIGQPPNHLIRLRIISEERMQIAAEMSKL